MRTTYIVLIPKTKGAWEVLAIAPKGLWQEYVTLAVGDIGGVRVVPLTLVRKCREFNEALTSYLETHQFPPPLSLRPRGKITVGEQKIASIELRSEIKSLERKTREMKFYGTAHRAKSKLDLEREKPMASLKSEDTVVIGVELRNGLLRPVYGLREMPTTEVEESSHGRA